MMTLEQFKTTMVEKKVSLNFLCDELELTYGGLSHAAKKPIPGVVYDINQINYDEIYAFIGRQGKLEELDNVDFENYEPKKKARKDLVKPEVGEIWIIDNIKYCVMLTTNAEVCLQSQKDETLRCMGFTRLNQVGEKF